LVLPRETLKNELKTKEGRKANPSPPTHKGIVQQHSHEQQISTIEYKDSYRNPYNGTAP